MRRLLPFALALGAVATWAWIAARSAAGPATPVPGEAGAGGTAGGGGNIAAEIRPTTSDRGGGAAEDATVESGAPVPTRTPRDATMMLALPDGTFVPALNGARGAPALATAWDHGRPFSPIVGRFRNADGLDWYRHADDTLSTTQMVWREDLGQFDAATRVGRWIDEAPATGR